MLVLGRKKGESLLIGDDIELTIVEVKGNQVKVAVDAPKDVKILRSELKENSAKSNIVFKKAG